MSTSKQLDSGTGGQQPVAWWCEHGDGSIEVVMWPDARDKYAARGYAVTPLYPSPTEDDETEQVTDWKALGVDVVEYRHKYAPTEPKAGVVSEEIIDAARNLLAAKFSTYKARNGRDVGIEDDNGEKCWIVPFDEVFALETALAALNGDKP